MVTEPPCLGPGGYGRCPLAVEEEVEDSLLFETFIDRVLHDLRSVI
jgi:hypothetical protein